jgi:hypothetical protein
VSREKRGDISDCYWLHAKIIFMDNPYHLTTKQHVECVAVNINPTINKELDPKWVQFFFIINLFFALDYGVTPYFRISILITKYGG